MRVTADPSAKKRSAMNCASTRMCRETPRLQFSEHWATWASFPPPSPPLPPHLPYKDSYINVLVFGQSAFKQKVKQFELILFYLFFLISRITGSPTLPCSKAWSLDSRPGYRKKRLKMPLLNFLTGRLSFIPPSELFFTSPWTGEGTVWPGHTAIGCDFLSKNIQEIETEAIIRVFKSIKFTFGIRAAEYAVLQTLWITEDVY